MTIVQKTQAGQTLKCSACGTTLEVPTLLGLQKLEPHVAAETAPRSRRGSQTGLVFSLGLGVGSLCALTALVLFLLAMFWQPERTMESTPKEIDDRFDEMEAESLLVVWDDIDNTGLGEPIPPPFVAYARRAAKLRSFAYAFSGVAGFAFLISLGMFFRDFRR